MSSGATRRHSRLALVSSQVGQVVGVASGFGSRRFSGRLPGLPSSILSLAGLGFRPDLPLVPGIVKNSFFAITHAELPRGPYRRLVSDFRPACLRNIVALPLDSTRFAHFRFVGENSGDCFDPTNPSDRDRHRWDHLLRLTHLSIFRGLFRASHSASFCSIFGISILLLDAGLNPNSCANLRTCSKLLSRIPTSGRGLKNVPLLLVTCSSVPTFRFLISVKY